MSLADTLRDEGGLLAAAVDPEAPADGDGPYAAVLAAIGGRPLVVVVHDSVEGDADGLGRSPAAAGPAG